MRSRFAPLLSILVRTSGVAGAARALPLFGGIGVVAAVLFGGSNGLRARTVVEAAHESPRVLLGLWLLWIAAILPIARAVLTERTATFLRALPVSRWQTTAALGLMLVAFQAPWVLLWAIGGGPLEGVAAALVGAGFASAVVARPSRWRDRALAVPLLLGAFFLSHPVIALAVALPAAIAAVGLAWARAAEAPRPAFSWIGGPPPLSLSLGYHLRLLRADTAVLVRGAIALTIAGLLAGIAARNVDALGPADFRSLSLQVGALVLTIACAGTAFTVRHAEASLLWFLDAAGVRRSTRVMASRGTVAVWGLIFGVVFGAAMATSAKVEPAIAVCGALVDALLGACIGALASEAAHRTPGLLRAQGGRFVAALSAIATVALVLMLVLGERGVILLGAAALVLCARSVKSPLSPRSKRKDEEGTVPMIVEASNVRKRFGVRQILDGVRLVRERPGVLAIAGENGSGKSTLLKIVCGVVPADAGRISICGHDLAGAREQALRNLGYVPDTLDLPGFLSVKEWVALVASLKQARAPAPEVAECLGVAPILRERLEGLSLGQRRRVGLLGALVGDPALLVLDEPTNGLDREGVEMLLGLLESRTRAGCATLLTTHERGFRDAAADEVVCLVEGRLTMGRSAA
jgi:ABC-type Mn2+/Zn2+ transport system ATPase subunit